MAAVFEISMLFKDILPVNIFLDMLTKIEILFSIKSIEVMDNWKYENQNSLDLRTSTKTLTDYVTNKKIVVLNGLLNNHHQCGYTSEVIENKLNLIDIWISLKDLDYLDKNYITKENLEVYESITEKIVELNEHFKLHLCAIGVETYLKYSKHIDSIIEGSSNINRWIIPDRHQLSKNYGFTKTKKSDFTILSRELH